MFLLYSLVIGLVVGLIVGGRPGRLSDLRFEWVWLAVAALFVQLVLFTEPMTTAIGSLGPPIYVASTTLVLVVVVRNLRRAPGLAIVVLGTLCNLAAIVANGGYMPVTPKALGLAEPVATIYYGNSVFTPEPALEALVDRFALPGWLPFTNVFSVGDVLIGLGIVAVMVVGMRRRSPPFTTSPTEPASEAVRPAASMGDVPAP